MDGKGRLLEGGLDGARQAVEARPAEDDSSHLYMKTGLLSLIAHDIRSPMSVAMRALDELEIACDAQLGSEPLGPKPLHYLAMARRALLRLQRLAERLSVTAQLENGGFELNRARADVVKIVRDAVDEAVMLHGRSSVTIQRNMPEGPLWEVVDEVWLTRALTEIMSNAVRHARHQVRVRIESTGDGFALTVDDDGGGMTPAARATAFQRFTPRELPDGLGLGLCVAHDVVVAHGGRLRLEASVPDADRPGVMLTRFVVEIGPLATSAPGGP